MRFSEFSSLDQQAMSVLLMLVVVAVLASNPTMHPGLQATIMGAALWLARPIAQGVLHYLRLAGLVLCALLVVLTGVELVG
ncbi:hypothetical protein ACFPAF_17160 [Hymenobacter endophyticus]|uniref:Uncharacterized protein n=1 Tax=Hymenobacter endophyticus TaxID=3076335 RepID=A0ABU3TLS7_9BACT|nr:hypothetical protein [Hymenobacter endophyticus]MDU0372135.1 hypothetical protein [Hymenobacter endophyticus]